MSNSAITVNELLFTRDGRSIIDNVSFSVSRGELIGIIGPNGAGKSTLIKLILGLLKPDSGEINIDGKDICTYPAKDLFRKIAYVPQENNLDFPMTVRETVLLGRIPHLSRFHLENERDYKIAEESLRMAGIPDFADRFANQLSMGEKQLVTIAKALAQETDYIFLDEPTSSLDISHTIEIMDILTGLKLKGKTVISAVHDLNTASRYFDKILIINNGIIKGFGKPEEVLTEEIIKDSFSVSVNIHKSEKTGNVLIEPLKPGG